jgi:hypothetical protein
MNRIIYKLGIFFGRRFRVWYFKRYGIWRWGLVGWILDNKKEEFQERIRKLW